MKIRTALLPSVLRVASALIRARVRSFIRLRRSILAHAYIQEEEGREEGEGGQMADLRLRL